MKRILLKIGGYSAVCLGFAGAFLPVLPTTPFLLLAVYCFSKSYPEMNDWIYANKHFGEYLKNYNCGKGIPGFVKFSAIVTMCSVITFTAIIFIQETWIRLLLFATALAVSVHIATLKTCRNEQED